MARFACFLSLFHRIEAQKNERDNLAWYHPDYFLQADKIKLITICKDLVVDIKYKVHMTDGIRGKMESDHTFLFHVGTTLGAMREQYKQQLEIYRQMRDRYVQRHKFIVPENKKHFGGVHYVVAMEEIYNKEVLIENHIQAMLNVPKEKWDQQESNAPPEGISVGEHGLNLAMHPAVAPGAAGLAPPPGLTLRSGNNAEKVVGEVNEKELKRRYREEYYKRHKN